MSHAQAGDVLWPTSQSRVRTDGDRTLVKVVIPRVYQEEIAGGQTPCVSTDAFERIAVNGIRERLTPIVRDQR